MTSSTFPTVNKCTSIGREKHTVIADMDGTLLIGRSSFPYFALIAFEVGGVLRLLFYLISSPIAGLLYYFISESAGIQVLIFASMAGMKISSIESVARAVLPKFYLGDLHPDSWRVFSSCGKRCVLTANPRIMVEPFLKDFLGVDLVLGTEIGSYKGRATGLVCKPGILVGDKKAEALKKAFGEEKPDIGLGDRVTDAPFMALCKVITNIQTTYGQITKPSLWFNFMIKFIISRLSKWAYIFFTLVPTIIHYFMIKKKGDRREHYS